jgi:hypothetical protein
MLLQGLKTTGRIASNLVSNVFNETQEVPYPEETKTP